MQTSANNYEIWQKEFQQLHAEICDFFIQFLETKQCRCKREGCKHYNEQLSKLFGLRIDDLYNKKMQMGFATFQELTQRL